MEINIRNSYDKTNLESHTHRLNKVMCVIYLLTDIKSIERMLSKFHKPSALTKRMLVPMHKHSPIVCDNKIEPFRINWTIISLSPAVRLSI